MDNRRRMLMMSGDKSLVVFDSEQGGWVNGKVVSGNGPIVSGNLLLLKPDAIFYAADKNGNKFDFSKYKSVYIEFVNYYNLSATNITSDITLRRSLSTSSDSMITGFFHYKTLMYAENIDVKEQGYISFRSHPGIAVKKMMFT